jgi:ankyrin repeat protein
MSKFPSGLPARPSLEQLRKRAKDLLRAARAADADSIARFRAAGAWRDPVQLADAQLVIAREHGVPSWAGLSRQVAGLNEQPNEGRARPMIRPAELEESRPYTLVDGTVVSTDDVWRMFVATRDGDIDEVRSLVKKATGLALVEYNYTPPIHFAVREGHRELTEFLIERGADFAGYKTYPFGDALLTMAEDREHEDVADLLRGRLARRFKVAAGTREILDAAKASDIDRVRNELARDPQLARVGNEVGDTALHHAAHSGNLEMVELLLNAGADPDAVRGDGYRPIHMALMPNWLLGGPSDSHAPIVSLLLEKGARYTVFIAAMRHDTPFVRDALRRDSSLASEEDTNHHRPLSAAVRNNDIALARLLLDHGADPNLPEEGAPRGYALWTAVHDRRHELARLLLEHGADPNAPVESSGTPMMMSERDPELFALLEQHGGALERNERDQLAHAVGKRQFAQAEQMIRDNPALIGDKSSMWWQGILAGPARDGDHDMIEFLMRLGATVPPVSEWAPFYYFKHETTAAFLLEHGMDPNHMNWQRVTLLHYMASEGLLAKARLLVEHGADIDAIDDEYRSTPLGLAARRGQYELVRFLLDNGADPDITGAPWATPLSWARRRGHDTVATLLEGGPWPS